MSSTCYGAALGVLSVGLVVWTVVFFVLFRDRFPPLGKNRRTPPFLAKSAYAALPASAIVLVALPLYGHYFAQPTFFACATAFYLFEFLWIPVDCVDRPAFIAIVLFAAACALTTTVVVGASDNALDSDEKRWMFWGVFSLPLANVWLNDLLYYCYARETDRVTRAFSSTRMTYY